MDKLNRLLVASPLEFAAAFGAATKDSTNEVSQLEVTLWLEGGLAPGAGFMWGHGQITYQGNNHPFRISGLSAADVGAVSMCAAGSVTHLRKLSDFSGNYSASGAGAIVAGGCTTFLQNQHGVVIQLTAKDAGRRISLPINGVRVRLKRQT
jgi:hypothetical protein